MIPRLVRGTALALPLVALPTLAQVPLDLTHWNAESYDAVSGFGAGVWTVDALGESVFQSVNGQPTLFYSPFDAFNTQAEGQIATQPGDDDYVGFAIGFEPGDTNNPNADYLLIDWKRNTQYFNFGSPSCAQGGSAPVGLAVSRVRGIPTADEFWAHETYVHSPCTGPNDGLTELARGANLGDVGWVPGQTYSFRFDFSATTLRVFVDDVLEIEVQGLFSNGRLAFYNFSQAQVTYSAYTVNCAAGWTNIGTGFPGTNGAPQLTLADDPVLGTSTSFLLTSSNPEPTVGFAAYGAAPDALPTPLGGFLWLKPQGVVVLALAPGTTAIPFSVPLDIGLCATASYFQLAEVDLGAAFGIAFSPGLEVVYGF